MRSPSWRSDVSPYQWLVLLVAWLGWVFDSMDSTIFALVLQPALRELLLAGGVRVVDAGAIAWTGGIIFSIFLIGWALGGVLFGVVADRVGRTRTLVFTILIYAVFTGLAALARRWWQLALCRFLTALGIGGEWAAGAALVAEVWPEHLRSRAAGILQSAWAAGFLIAAVINLAMKGFGWRPLFVVGVAPALVALAVRAWVREPERWLHARAASRRAPPGAIRELFGPALARSTWIGSALAFVAVFGLWGATNWTPTLVRALPDVQHLDAAAQSARVSYAAMLLNAGALVGYLGFGPLADRLGRRAAFAIYCAGSLVMLPATFLAPGSLARVLLLVPVLGFFNNGIFTGFPIYLPELYPTRLRATGAGFCFNAGRLLAAGAPLLTGLLVGGLGSFGRAASAIAAIYLLGLLLLPFAPETRGRALPE